MALDDEDFIGRDALIERKAHPQRQLVGLELEGDEVAGHGDEVYVGPPARRRRHQRNPQPDAEAARSRCAGWRSQYAEIGTEVEIGKLDGLQKRIPARVVRLPVL